MNFEERKEPLAPDIQVPSHVQSLEDKDEKVKVKTETKNNATNANYQWHRCISCSVAVLPSTFLMAQHLLKVHNLDFSETFEPMPITSDSSTLVMKLRPGFAEKMDFKPLYVNIERLPKDKTKWPCYNDGLTIQKIQSHVEINTEINFDDEPQPGPSTSFSGIASNCQVVVKTEEGLDMHQCPICSILSTTKSNLNVHMKAHGTNFICPYCSIGFNFINSLTKHEKTAHWDLIKEGFTCDICSNIAPTLAHLQQHKARHKKVLAAERENGQAPADSSGVNDDSLNITNGEPVDESLEENGILQEAAAEVIKCPICPLTFTSRPSLSIHKYIHGTAFICNYCPVGFNFLNSLHKHEKSFHWDEIKDGFSCDFCSKLLPTLTHLKQHRNERHSKALAAVAAAEALALEKENTSIELNTRTDEDLNIPESDSETTKNENDVEQFPYVDDGSNKCHECTLVFTTRGNLEAHRKRHGTAFICNYCPVGFNFLNSLLKHEKYFHWDEIKDGFSCDFCSKLLPTLTHLKQHRNESHSKALAAVAAAEALALKKESCSGELNTRAEEDLNSVESDSETTIKCHECNLVFRTGQHLRDHRKRHGTAFKCQYCPIGFNFLLSLHKHQKINHWDLISEGFPCAQCSKVPPTLYHLEQHVSKRHKTSTTSTPTTTTGGEESFSLVNSACSCPECGALLKNKYSLEKHLEVHGEDFPCPHCPTGFQNEKSLNRHIKLMHEDIQVKVNYSCADCQLDFKNKHYLKQHLRTHGTDFPCWDCSVGFKFINMLTVHRRKLHPDKPPKAPLVCVECDGWSFTHGQILRKHKRLHGSEFLCPDCPTGFKYENVLKIHRRKAHGFEGGYKPKSERRTPVEIENLNPENECFECHVKFKDKYSLNAHAKRHGTKFPCPYCPAGFKFVNLLTRHKKKAHKGNSKFKCHICGEAYKNKYLFDRHVDSHGDAFICPHCPLQKPPIGFKDNATLNLHLCKLHKDRVYNKENKCFECGKKFKDKYVLNSHSKKHGVEFMCAHCPAGFKTEQMRSSHINELHKELLPINPDNECGECGKKFRDRHSLITHGKKHGTEFLCPYCKVGYNTENGLSFHITRAHQDQCQGEDAICPDPHCGKKFRDKYSLKHHVLKHGSEFPCSYCPTGFKTENMLSMHLNSKHPEESQDGQGQVYPCPECGAHFKSSQTVRRHLQLHGKEFPCPHCSTGFKYKNILGMHLKKMHPDLATAANAKHGVFKCDECGAVLKTATGLNTHINSHGSEFQCQECPTGFKFENGLTMHYRKMHYMEGLGKKFKTCQDCGGEFKTDTYEAHLEQHGTEFMCLECPAGFSTEHYLRRHIRKMHSTYQGYSEAHGHFDAKFGVGVCPHCGDMFNAIDILQVHMNGHGPQCPCPECPATFKHINGVTIHRSRMHSTKINLKFHCANCPKRFSTLPQRRFHKEKVHRIKGNNNCPTITDSIPEIDPEIPDAAPGPPPVLIARTTASSPTPKVPIISTPAQPQRYKCNQCDAEFKAIANLKRHKILHRSGLNLKYKCTLCPSVFALRYSLTVHMKNVHESQKPKGSVPGVVPKTKSKKCEHCSKEFLHQFALQRHKIVFHKMDRLQTQAQGVPAIEFVDNFQKIEFVNVNVTPTLGQGEKDEEEIEMILPFEEEEMEYDPLGDTDKAEDDEDVQGPMINIIKSELMID